LTTKDQPPQLQNPPNNFETGKSLGALDEQVIRMLRMDYIAGRDIQHLIGWKTANLTMERVLAEAMWGL
jgi:hypothetical protein